MIVNGIEKSCIGLSFAKIGKMLQEMSPKRDGIGLNVTLTSNEERVFVANFGLGVGQTLSVIIGDAVEAETKRKPAFKYVYNSDRVFITTAV